MFDLENAILGWRKRMLAAGIEAPVPLDELESHVRDEVDAGIKTGLAPADAFAQAVDRIGSAQPLKTEFKKAGGIFWWLGNTRQQRIYRALAIIWGLFSIASLVMFAVSFAGFAFSKSPRLTPDLFLAILLFYLYYRMMKSSYGLFTGHLEDRFLLWGVAMLSFFVDLCSIFSGHIGPMGIAMTIFSGASIWLLRPKKTSIIAK